MKSSKLAPPLLVIIGETASGKSTLAMGLAARLNGEIISADSWTTRRGLDIGTAKPSKADQKRVEHYLIDVAEPDADFTVADFKPLAEKAINSIARKRKLPIMVGGSGLYIDSVLYNFSFLEAGDREKRKVLNGKTIEELTRIINQLGIKIPSNLDTNNKRRLIRLIETNGKLPTKDKLRNNTLIIGLSQDAQTRRQNIENRVEWMIKNGLEAEVETLVSKYGWNCDALKGVGYRQWQPYQNGQQSLSETRSQIVNASLNLAKKQRTWFKQNKSIHWFTTPVNVAQVVAFVTTKLSRPDFN